jgi:hypothetical protein
MRTGGVSHPRSTSTNQCGEGNDAPVTRVKVRLIPGSYSPTIESISAANRAFADRGSAALSRSVDLARRRLRGYCRARLDCRGGSPSGSRPSADLGQAIGRNASASGDGGDVQGSARPVAVASRIGNLPPSGDACQSASQ